MPHELTELIKNNRPVIALTGAGISTHSGIPAYRDSNGSWIQSKPVQAQEFRAKESVRRRYWQRSMAGWPNFHTAIPNNAHRALAELEESSVVSTVITQNVDGLHQRAGSKQVIDLHGSLAKVVCLGCGEHSRREELQSRLELQNKDFLGNEFRMLADGDATITNSIASEHEFEIAACLNCGGVLKPDVVFYGENVPVPRVEHCMNELEHAAMLLCIGTSLAVFSGYRFCRAANQANKPIALINQGSTRADDLASMKVNEDCADTLVSLCKDLL